jgi:hypothetical protein
MKKLTAVLRQITNNKDEMDSKKSAPPSKPIPGRLIIHVLRESGPSCALCKLDGEPVSNVAYFLAGLSYGIHQRDLPICLRHLPILKRTAEESGDVWDDVSGVTH